MNEPKLPALSIDKETLGQMPQEEFCGRIKVVEDAADMRSAVRYLSRQPLLGFDTETRPTFRKGSTHNVSLIQISTPDICFLFRIKKTGFIEPLRKLLEQDNVIKVGLSVKDDFHGLHKLGDFEPRSFVELQDFVKQYGIADASLQKIYAIIFGRRISKGQRLTNWESETLTDLQQKYAALDAYACLKIYDYLTEGRFDPYSSPYVKPESSTEIPNQ